MKRGEKGIIILISVVVLGLMGRNLFVIESDHEIDKGIPYYSTASAILARDAMGCIPQRQTAKTATPCGRSGTCWKAFLLRFSTDWVPCMTKNGFISIFPQPIRRQYYHHV
ncbi:MAG: hypothetical protein WDM70_04380 [Nitrosomonadales bacterium]